MIFNRVIGYWSILCCLGAGLVIQASALAVEFKTIGPGGGGTPGALAVDENNPDVMYVGLDCGGMHVSEDGGKTWQNANKGINFSDSYDMKWNCHSTLLTLPSGRVITASDGGAIYISDDHAKTWTKAFKTKAGGIAELYKLPGAPNKIYAASTVYGGMHPRRIKLKKADTDKRKVSGGQIYVSEKSGAPGSWKLVNTDKKNNIPTKATFKDLAADYKYNKIMYATTDYGLYRSKDGGVSWKSIQDGLGQMVAKNVVAIPGKPGVVYVSVGDFVDKMLGKTPGVYKSEDYGQTWTAKCKGLNPSQKGFYALTVDPLNPKVLYLGCHDWYGGLYRSLDAGENWQVVLDSKNSVAKRNWTWHPEPKHVAVGLDIVVSGVDRDKDGMSDIVTFIGDNVGHITRSMDGGKSWQQLISNRKVINGMAYWAGRGAIDFLCVRRVVVDPTDPKHIWVSYFDWGLFESVDGGKSFRIAFGPWLAGELIGGTHSVILDPDDPQNVFVSVARNPGGRRGGVISNIGSKGFWKIGGMKKGHRGLPNGAVCGLAIIRDGESKYLYATSSNNGVYRIDLKKLSAWEKVSDGLSKQKRNALWALECVNNTLPLYLSTSDGLYRSDDGLTWKRLTGEGTRHPEIVRAPGLVVDPQNPEVLYLTILNAYRVQPEQGVYCSVDGGRNFKKIADIPIPYELDLVGSGKNSVLYVASQANGVYKLRQNESGQWISEIFADQRNGLDLTRCWTVNADLQNSGRIYIGTHGAGVFMSSKVKVKKEDSK